MLSTIISSIIQTAGFTLSAILLINSIRPEKVTIKEAVSLGLLCEILLIPYLFIGSLGAPIMFAILFLYFLVRKKYILINICMVFLAYILFVFSSSIISTITYALNLEYLFAPSASLSAVILMFPLIFIGIGISFLISKILYRYARTYATNKEIASVTLINLLVCMIIFIFNIIAGEQIGNSSKTTFFNGVLFFLYFFVTSISLSNVIKSYKAKLELTNRLNSYERLHEYTRQIEAVYLELKTFKHDYANIMFSFQDYINNKDMDGLSHYFQHEIYPHSQDIINSSFDVAKLIHILDSEVKSLIYGKAVYATEIGINIMIEALEPIKVANIALLDFIRILGVFLDNAIEACSETKEPSCSIAFLNSNSTLVVIVANNFTEIPLSIHDLNKLSVSTKGKDRGVGLYNIAQIISNYSNISWNTEIKNSFFIQHIEISSVSLSDSVLLS